MKRLNVMISDEAKAVIVKFQEDNNITTLDSATDKYIKEAELAKSKLEENQNE